MEKKKDTAQLKVVPSIESQPVVFETPKEHYNYLIREHEKPHTGILGGAIARKSLAQYFPFAFVSREYTPFADTGRQLTLSLIVDELVSFARECDDSKLKFEATGMEFDFKRDELIDDAKKIYSRLKSLIPKKGNSYRAHPEIRALSILPNMPEVLFTFVEEFKFILERYDQTCDEKNTIKKTRGRNYLTKKQSVVLFWETVFMERYPADDIELDSSSYETIACSFLACSCATK